jgi:hypothetical protein
VDFSEKEASSMTSTWCLRVLGTGLKDVTFDKNKFYSVCQAGKQVAIHHPLKDNAIHLQAS